MIWIRRLLVVTGTLIVVYGVRNVLMSLGPDLDHYLRYLGIAWLANDLFVLPSAIVIGFVISRLLTPGPAGPAATTGSRRAAVRGPEGRPGGSVSPEAPAPGGVRAPVKPVVQGALFISLVVVIVALPAVIGRGVPLDNPSALPRDYAAGLLVTLAAVWLGAGALVAWPALRRKRPPIPTPRPPRQEKP